MGKMFGEKAAKILVAIRKQNPLIHNITNYVVMNYTANVLLACGASPVMAHAMAEVEEMTSLAEALVLNIGTLSPIWIKAMYLAGVRANQLGIPVVLDPVGVGATCLRTQTVKNLLSKIKISLLRGNASEINSLWDNKEKTKGVDAIHNVKEVALIAFNLSRAWRIPIAITGEHDFITDGKHMFKVYNGHPIMSKITGMGCIATALIGTFLAVEPDPINATVSALAVLGLAGEIAADKSLGPGSFSVTLLDVFYNLSDQIVSTRVRVSQI